MFHYKGRKRRNEKRSMILHQGGNDNTLKTEDEKYGQASLERIVS